MIEMIAVEEHVALPEVDEYLNGGAEVPGAEPDVPEELLLPDVERRLREMDACGVAVAILSLVSPGIQAVADVDTAVHAARMANDVLFRDFVGAHPERFAFFASVALQHPEQAATELERAVTQLGARGAMINGFTNVGDADNCRYLDELDYAPFWAKATELGVPVYLHPREPLPDQRRPYEGYPALVSAAWGFGQDTATHAVRLMLSGVFDEHPGLQIILGHLGEGLPNTLPRLEHRLRKEGVRVPARRPVSHYLTHNFLLTTSGHFHTRTLLNAISEVGVDRMLFAIDYPFETMQDGVEWLDSCPLSENDRQKIGYGNATRLFDLGAPRDK